MSTSMGIMDNIEMSSSLSERHESMELNRNRARGTERDGCC